MSSPIEGVDSHRSFVRQSLAMPREKKRRGARRAGKKEKVLGRKKYAVPIIQSKGEAGNDLPLKKEMSALRGEVGCFAVDF